MIPSITAARVSVAQTVVVDGPPGPVLPTLTPSFTIRASGFPTDTRPFRYTLFITRNSTGDSPFEQTLQLSSNDSIVTLRVARLLPAEAAVYWKARVTLPDGRIFESTISTVRKVPRWLTLIEPKPFGGGQYPTRRPQFIWQTGKIDPEYGAWVYDFELLDDNGTALSSRLSDTTFVPPTPLSANTLYRYQVRATVVGASSEAIIERSSVKFQIIDPDVPTSTLLYQNFPNPFPSPSAFVTCFWFDIASGGALVTLDILDLRGTLVKSILPATRYEAGRYGVGNGQNCDNSGRLTWNGTSSDGRTVSAGIYLLRFKADKRVFFKKIMFVGR